MVKVGSECSNWSYLNKRATQDSYFGPFVYNVLSKDMLYLIADQCDIYNYVDDNYIGYQDSNADDVITWKVVKCHVNMVQAKLNSAKP